MLIFMILVTVALLGLGIAVLCLRKTKSPSNTDSDEITTVDTKVVLSKVKRNRIIAIIILIILFIGGWVLAIMQIDTPSGVGEDKVKSNTISEYLLYSTAQTAVKSKLKSPSTAKFQKSPDIYELDDDKYKISGYVDSQNSFGAILRGYFTVVISYKDDKYTVISCTVHN